MLARKCLILVLCFGVSACQWLGVSEHEPVLNPNFLESLTPADIEPAVLSLRQQVQPSVQDVIDNYTVLLPLLADPQEKLRVLHRLADLKLARGENLMVEQAIDELDVAVEAYQGLLARYPDRDVNDAILYQLAKTYELKGQPEAQLETLTRLIKDYPHSKYAAEVQFRRGEMLFTWNDYPEAEKAFQFVIDQGDTPFLINAHYMKGWSQFKQTRYQGALLAYTQVLDLVLPRNMLLEEVPAQYQTLIKDLFRVMGLSFSYLGGADALEKLFVRIGEKPYETLVYDQYSELLLAKEQYTDVIEVYQRYIALHPLSLWSPRYQIKLIETLYIAGFKSDILEEKVRFVDEYGLGSAYWFENRDKDLSFVFEQLEGLIPELANRHYVLAQRTKQGDPERLEHYRKAAYYYQAFVETFPKHVDTPESLFLLGECHVALQDWVPAISAFEAAGYDFANYGKAAEAAYASILAFNDYARTWTQDQPEEWLKNRTAQQESRLRFVNVHTEDERADDVLYVATQYAYQIKNYGQSITLAERLLAWQPAVAENTLLETRIIRSHSFYALQDFFNAEPAYLDALKVLPEKDKRRSALIENLAASIYRQAEQRLAAGDMESAVSELLRIREVAPAASLRPNAEYDAISYLVELKSWTRAIEEIKVFRSRYPKHELINTLVPKMALAYRETEQWSLAADELKVMIGLAKTEDEKRDTQFIVAELYDRADNIDPAIKAYRKYANTYPTPADVYMEAANRLAELYEQTNQPLKRRFWLAKMMKTVDQAPDKADDRMVYLAASSSAVLADDAFRKYKSIKLTLPLNKTMVRKTEALENAMKAYQKTASYGISAYATEAGFRMADIYAQLSRDLMDSDRPEGLNALEMEQYEILLEEQAFPFEENAIDIHEQNASRSWDGIYDEWVKSSFASLKDLLPGRYDKPESPGGLINVLD